MIERYSMIVGDCQVTDPEGDWMRYEDHLKVVGELQQEVEELELELASADNALREAGERD